MLKLGESMIDYEDNLEEAQTRPRHQIALLKKSILARVFRGKI